MPKRYKAGDPLHISAYAWNRMLDMIGYDVDANSDWRKGSLPVSWLFVKNVHRSPRIERGSPVCIVAPTDLTGVELIEYRTNPQDFVFHSIHSWFGNYHHQHFGIALEPIEYEGVGRVAISGVVWANFKVVEGEIADYIDTMKFVHMLPDTDPDYHEFLQLNTSGFAERFGDHVRLGISQPLFMYKVTNVITNPAVFTDVEITADIYGIPETLGLGDSSPTHIIDGVQLHPHPPMFSTGYALGDYGLCSAVGDRFIPIDDMHRSPITGNTVGSITAGGVGFVEVYRTDGTTGARNACLDADDNPITVKVHYDMSGDPIPSGTKIHAKCVGDAHIIDVVECSA